MVAPIVLAMTAAPHSDAADYDNTKGDFILGFREVGSTTSILVNLGPITNLTTSQTLSLGSVSSLLSSKYGSKWATSPNVYFSLAATSRPQDGTAPVNYVTSPEYPADGVAAVIWRRLTQTNSSILQNKIINSGEDYNTFSAQSGTNAVLEPSTSPDAYQNFMPGGTSDSGHATQGNIGWGFFNPTPEGSFKSGAAGVVLHLIQVTPGFGSGTDLGNFVLSADGSTLTFTSNSPPAITSATSATASAGKAFSYQIAATNSPTSYDASGLPDGLTVNQSTGLISGTPTTAGSYTVTITATNAGGTGSANLALTVQQAGAPVITSATSATGKVGVSFAYQITATNNPTGYSTSSVPPGLSFSTSTGSFTGTPTKAGTYKPLLSAINGAGTARINLDLTVNPAPPVVTSATTATAQVGVAFSYQATATNSPTSYSISSLPPGLTFDTATGKLSGTPTKAGSYRPLIAAVNAGGSGSANVALTVNSAKPVITSATTASAQVGVAFSYQVTATNSPTSYATTSVPPGLTFSTTTGKFTGTPTKAGTYKPLVSATNSGGTASVNVEITVKPAKPVITSATSATATVGEAFTYQIVATNSPTSYATSSIPPGLSFSTGTGKFTGTPTKAGTYKPLLSATNSGGTTSVNLNLVVSAAQ